MQKIIKVSVLMDDLAGKMRGIRAHHGLSFLFEIEYSKNNVFRMLFDTGTNGADLLNNIGLMNVDVDTIDAAIITHKHYDHTGGLPEILELRGAPLTVFSGQDMFVPAFMNNPWKEAGIPYTKGSLEEKGACFVEITEPYEIVPDCFISGPIEIFDSKYENIQGFTRIKNGKKDAEKQQEELAFYVVEGDRVHVFSGCSHRGIVNICKDALKKTGKEKIGIIMGGFHFVNSSIDTINMNIEELKKMEPLAVLAGHCTGFSGLAMLFNSFGKRFGRYACSDRFNFIQD
jgi:7,8-dihydropterin-6-yl-methyl-4-(beta-D-ribofuranosyl)aminobenzene 5'-phosphate synthase